MRLCFEEAKRGLKKGEFPFASCVVKDGKTISLVHNKQRSTHSLDVTEHAEVQAIREACRKLKTTQLSECVLYTDCEPCVMCYGTAYWAGISRIVYGGRVEDVANYEADNPLIISIEKLNELGKSKIEIVGDFLRDESLEILREYSYEGRRGKSQKNI
jgi:tRNA(Arg) A34 adenosine deaminase TadA